MQDFNIHFYSTEQFIFSDHTAVKKIQLKNPQLAFGSTFMYHFKTI